MSTVNDPISSVPVPVPPPPLPPPKTAKVQPVEETAEVKTHIKKEKDIISFTKENNRIARNRAEQAYQPTNHDLGQNINLLI